MDYIPYSHWPSSPCPPSSCSHSAGRFIVIFFFILILCASQLHPKSRCMHLFQTISAHASTLHMSSYSYSRSPCPHQPPPLHPTQYHPNWNCLTLLSYPPLVCSLPPRSWSIRLSPPHLLSLYTLPLHPLLPIYTDAFPNTSSSASTNLIPEPPHPLTDVSYTYHFPPTQPSALRPDPLSLT